MIRMLYSRRCSIVQSIASITSLDRPRPVVAQHAQVEEIRAGRDAAVVARVGGPARLAGDDRRHVRAVAVAIDARRRR